MKIRIFTTLLIMFAYMSNAQQLLVNPSNIKFAHMGESVAQYNGYSVVGAYEDGDDTNGDFFNETYTGAVRLYNWGNLIRTYKLNDPDNHFTTMGRSVAITDNWVAASAGKGGTGRIHLAKKVNGQYASTMNYLIESTDFDWGTFRPFAMTDEFIVVGSPQSDIDGINSGAAYVYRYFPSQDQWLLVNMLIPGDGVSGAKFGTSVSVSGDKIVVGAPEYPGGGRFYVFKADNHTSTSFNWVEEFAFTSYDVLDGDDYGYGVSIDGDDLIVTAPGFGSDIGRIQFFEYSASQDRWGSISIFYNVPGALTTLHDGKAAVSTKYVSQYNQPFAVEIFSKQSGWTHYGTYEPANSLSNQFGSSIAIHNGNMIIGMKGYDKTSSNANEGAATFINFWNAAYGMTSRASVGEESVKYAKIYPNPASDVIHTENGLVSIYSMTGALMLQKHSEGTLDITSLTSGVYTINVNGKQTKLIVE